jgi:hypothetical protein
MQFGYDSHPQSVPSFLLSDQQKMTQSIERIPDSTGYLILNEDGAVLSVSVYITDESERNNAIFFFSQGAIL